MPTMSKEGEEDLTMSGTESGLQQGLDFSWIRFEEIRLVDEMLMVVIWIFCSDQNTKHIARDND